MSGQIMIVLTMMRSENARMVHCTGLVFSGPAKSDTTGTSIQLSGLFHVMSNCMAVRRSCNAVRLNPTPIRSVVLACALLAEACP